MASQDGTGGAWGYFPVVLAGEIAFHDSSNISRSNRVRCAILALGLRRLGMAADLHPFSAKKGKTNL
jgi:hypothetical protein